MKDKTCREFTDLLASKTPVPGGGGAAALCGAIGISLGSMVGEYTVGKKNYEEVSKDIEILLERAEGLRKKFFSLIDEDARAFLPLSEAYSVPKENPERVNLLEAASIEAAEPPLEMVRCCGKALEILRDFQIKGNKMLVSDACCGGIICRAAMEAAAINVRINTKNIIDRKLADKMEEEVRELLDRYIPLSETIVSSASDSL